MLFAQATSPDASIFATNPFKPASPDYNGPIIATVCSCNKHIPGKCQLRLELHSSEYTPPAFITPLKFVIRIIFREKISSLPAEYMVVLPKLAVP